MEVENGITMKIGILGDLHFRESLAYADYIIDRREGERKQVLDFIIEKFNDCDGIVFLGDNFDKVSNGPEIIRAFTAFVERFNGKQIYILAGNHEKRANGSTAIDYLKEVKNPNWHIITNTIEEFSNMVFCPYFYRQEIGVETYTEGTKLLTERLKSFKNKPVLFIHHAISDTLTTTGQSTNLFPEMVFSKKELESIFDLTIAGHIHKPKRYGKTLITGSIFSNEVGDIENFIYKIETNSLTIEQFKLPTRAIYKLENPTLEELKILSTESIVKVMLTKHNLITVDEYKKALKRFDTYILLEKYPDKRQKIDLENGAMVEFTVENLLKMYAEAKQIQVAKLLSAWEIIKK